MSDAEDGTNPGPEPEQEHVLEQAIRERAFLIWELEGMPEGREDEY